MLWIPIRATLPKQIKKSILGSNWARTLSNSSVSRKSSSNFIFHRLYINGLCGCSTFNTFNGTKIMLQNQNVSSFSNKALKLAANHLPDSHHRDFVNYYCSCSNAAEPEKKLSLFQRFKKMYKEYGYILVPVHCITSAFWFTSFYYLIESGVDIASLFESVGASEKLVEKLRNTNNSKMGYVALSYALYKIATPIRYTVTLGGTTLSIKYLRDWGYIKPIPPTDKLKEIIHDKKDKLMEKKENLKSRIGRKRLLKRPSLKIGLKKI